MNMFITCIECGSPLLGRQTLYCSKSCKTRSHGNSYPAQVRRALERKIRLVQEKGGCCSVCGYNTNLAALEFHHLDPLSKDFTLSSRKISNSTWENLVQEADKCELLCANCHRELHNPNLTGVLYH